MRHHVANVLTPYKRLIKWSVYCFLGVFITFLFCVYTESGTKATLQLINNHTPYRVSYQELTGNLANHLNIRSLKISNKDFTFEADSLSLDWQWLSLLRGEIHIEDIKGNKINIDLKQQQKSKSQTLKQINNKEALQQQLNQMLPLPLTLSHAQIENIHIKTHSLTHDIATLSLSGLQSTQLFTLKFFTYEGTFGSIQANQNHFLNIEWNLDIPSDFAITPELKKGLKSKGRVSIDLNDFENNKNTLEAQIDIPIIKMGDKEIENTKIDISGNTLSHELTANGTFEHPFKIKLNGKLDKNKWQGTLNQLLIVHPKMRQPIDAKGDILITKNKQLIISSKLNVLNQPMQADLTIGLNAPYSLKGQALAHVKNIQELKTYFPELRQSNGNLSIASQLSGTLFKPIMNGKADINGLQYPTPQYGVTTTIERLTLTKLPEYKQAKLEGVGNINGRTFNLDGMLDIEQENPEIHLNLKGKNLIVSQTPEYYIVASPDVSFHLKDKLPVLTGKIDIPEANITILKRTNKPTLSSDVVIMDDEKKQSSLKERTYPLKTELDISLGPNTKFKSNNLTSSFTGNLKVTQNPNQAPKLYGDINIVGGQYKFQGKTFNITHGKLIYAGNTFNNPLMDIEAKQVMLPLQHKEGFSAQTPLELGVRLKGKFDDPQIKFFSNPSMPEADVMSYIILGRPQGQVDQDRDAVLLTAITQFSSLFGSKDEDVSFNLAERLKLDHIGFSKIKKPNGYSLDDTVLTLGKQISNRLYLNYSRGISEATNQFGLQYRFNKNLSIEAHTGSHGPSADVILSIDR